jgi:hypothetical protein
MLIFSGLIGSSNLNGQDVFGGLMIGGGYTYSTFRSNHIDFTPHLGFNFTLGSFYPVSDKVIILSEMGITQAGANTTGRELGFYSSSEAERLKFSYIQLSYSVLTKYCIYSPSLSLLGGVGFCYRDDVRNSNFNSDLYLGESDDPNHNIHGYDLEQDFKYTSFKLEMGASFSLKNVLVSLRYLYFMGKFFDYTSDDNYNIFVKPSMLELKVLFNLRSDYSF